MKKAVCLALLLCLICQAASAMTVEEFVEVYNQTGWLMCSTFSDKIAYDLYEPDESNIMLLTYAYNGDKPVVAVAVVPGSAEKPKDMEVKYAYIMRRKTLSVSKYIEALAITTEVMFTNVPEDKRLGAICRCIYGPATVWDDAKGHPHTVTENGMMITYVEQKDSDLVMIEYAEEQP